MRVYAFVPAKGTSERVENKNMRFLDGERLYIRALKTLLKCKEIDQVFLDTESEEMYKLADYLPIKFMKRDPSLANNKTDGHKMFMNEVNSYPDADIYVQLLCTSPFIHPQTIDNAIRKIKENAEYDSAIMMKKDKYYLWENNKPTYDINHIPNSKDLPETIIESMGLYIHKKESAVKLNRRYGENPYLVFGDLEELIDVNTPEDLAFAEIYAKGKRNKENQSKETKDALMFLKQKVDAAQGFINAVKQRQQTLLSTMQAIIDLQRPFFQEGDEALLRPMILKDVAERTHLDISTISRVSNSKYVQTNFGIYPLKFFFSDGYITESGEELSVREIKRILKECIEKEDKTKPYTDDELADELKKKGYPIARRTVAKYRQQLNIPIARLRR